MDATLLAAATGLWRSGDSVLPGAQPRGPSAPMESAPEAATGAARGGSANQRETSRAPFLTPDADALLAAFAGAYDPPSRVMPEADWDLLFQAVAARLRLTVGASNVTHSADRISATVLECVQALEQLHAELTHERRRRRPIEDELRQSHVELACARQETTDVRADERRSHHMALHDSLTALPNRRGFNERWDAALAPPRVVAAVLYIDLDGFKSINDLHGHSAGDETLRIVAKRLSHSIRAQDMVCRMGGDEFACMLTDPMGREQLRELAGKLFDAVSAPMQVGLLQLSARPSIGIALSPDDGLDAQSLLQRADAAMYHAKRQQTGYAFFDSVDA